MMILGIGMTAVATDAFNQTEDVGITINQCSKDTTMNGTYKLAIVPNLEAGDADATGEIYAEYPHLIVGGLTDRGSCLPLYIELQGDGHGTGFTDELGGLNLDEVMINSLMGGAKTTALKYGNQGTISHDWQQYADNYKFMPMGPRQGIVNRTRMETADTQVKYYLVLYKLN